MPNPNEMVAEYIRRSGQPIVAGLTGHLWFSDKEWWILRDRGRDRTFAKLQNGNVVEYTEMISLEALQENPQDRCGFADAKYLGIGVFDHWEKYNDLGSARIL